MATAGGGRAPSESGGSGEDRTRPPLPDLNEDPPDVSEEETGQNCNLLLYCLRVAEEQIDNNTTIEDLPDGVLSNIFIRVSAKEITQMRTVTKPWNALLSEPSFVKFHLHHSIHNNNQILLVFYHKVCISDPKPFTAHLSRSPNIQLTEFNKRVPVNPRSKCTNTIIIIGAVNGLICSSYGHSIIHIWNPSLSAISTLPKFPMSFPRSSHVNLRFGYDPKANDYKVFKLIGKTLIGTIYEEWLQIGIYSMRNGSWVLIKERFPSHINRISDGDYVCLDGHDGLLHWLCYCTKAKKLTQTIVAFDLHSHKFSEIPLPHPVTEDESRSNIFAVLAGKLCVMSWAGEVVGWEVWVMEEYGVAESWVQRHVFAQVDAMYTYGFTSHGDFLVRFKNERVVMSDTIAETKVFEDYCNRKQHRPQKFVEYVDSLIWITPGEREMVDGAGQN